MPWGDIDSGSVQEERPSVTVQVLHLNLKTERILPGLKDEHSRLSSPCRSNALPCLHCFSETMLARTLASPRFLSTSAKSPLAGSATPPRFQAGGFANRAVCLPTISAVAKELGGQIAHASSPANKSTWSIGYTRATQFFACKCAKYASHIQVAGVPQR